MVKFSKLSKYLKVFLYIQLLTLAHLHDGIVDYANMPASALQMWPMYVPYYVCRHFTGGSESLTACKCKKYSMQIYDEVSKHIIIVKMFLQNIHNKYYINFNANVLQ